MKFSSSSMANSA